jgi:hypothetical protein
MQRGRARAKQRETEQSEGFDCVLPLERKEKGTEKEKSGNISGLDWHIAFAR